MLASSCESRLRPEDSARRGIRRLLSQIRIGISFRWRHGRWPKLRNPQTFNEHVQWRKLNDRNEQLARLTDKLAGKDLARTRLGAGAVVPTLWTGVLLPELPPAPLPLVLKANHGCNQSVIVRSQADWRRARRIAPRWLGAPYGGWLDEWHYCRARRTLLVEPLLGDGEALPLDYKVHVIRGRAEVMQVHLDRADRRRHRWVQLDRQWNRLSSPDGHSLPERPRTLQAMLDAAEQLAHGFDALRVDFYEIDGAMLFGEFCLFPGSGLDPFGPVELDARLGALWSRAEEAWCEAPDWTADRVGFRASTC